MSSYLAAGLSAAALAIAAFGIAAPPADRTPAKGERVAVVELYQSQGCSSCPPANAILNELTRRPDILALSFAVTYWDQLGWKDTFASEQYTRRQWDFARANGRGNVATPQFIMNGTTTVSGSDQRQVFAAIREAGLLSGEPQIAVDGSKILIGPGKSDRPATVWLVRYDPRERQVAIGRGENSGRTLPHRNIVTGLKNLGRWAGHAVAFGQPPYRDPAQRSAILIEQGIGGPIIAARPIG